VPRARLIRVALNPAFLGVSESFMIHASEELPMYFCVPRFWHGKRGIKRPRRERLRREEDGTEGGSRPGGGNLISDHKGERKRRGVQNIGRKKPPRMPGRISQRKK